VRAGLAEGSSLAGSGQEMCLGISRPREDTGYQPAYDTERAVADYLAWLRGPRALARYPAPFASAPAAEPDRVGDRNGRPA
jgi:hypothetical protein